MSERSFRTTLRPPSVVTSCRRSAKQGGLHRVRLALLSSAIACLAQRGDVIDVDAELEHGQGFGTRGGVGLGGRRDCGGGRNPTVRSILGKFVLSIQFARETN